MARIRQHFHRVLFQHFRIPLPHRPVDLPRLTETAAPDAPPLDLQHHPVLRHFDKGYYGL